ncbi:MAG: hypothetical protein ABI664_08775 [bacterium]
MTPTMPVTPDVANLASQVVNRAREFRVTVTIENGSAESAAYS